MLKALNRRRFKKRIRSTALKVEWRLKPKHREKKDCLGLYHASFMLIVFIVNTCKNNMYN